MVKLYKHKRYEHKFLTVDSAVEGDMACVNITNKSGYNDELSSLKISKSSNFCHVPDFAVSSGASKY